MKVFVLFGQRTCDYEGQYAPEALECINEFGHEESPDYLSNKLVEYRETDEFDSLEVLALEVPMSEILSGLYPIQKAIQAKVSHNQ